MGQNLDSSSVLKMFWSAVRRNLHMIQRSMVLPVLNLPLCHPHLRLAAVGHPVHLVLAGPLPPPFIPFDPSDPQRRRPPKQGPGLLTMPPSKGDNNGDASAAAAGHPAAGIGLQLQPEGELAGSAAATAQAGGPDIQDQLRQQAAMTSPPVGTGGAAAGPPPGSAPGTQGQQPAAKKASQ